MKQSCLSLTFGMLAVAAVSADNWPQWRGPQLNGTSAEKGLPVKWSADRERRVEAADAEPQRRDPDHLERPDLPERRAVRATGDLELWCVERGNGQVLWKRPLGGGNHQPAQAEHVVAVAGHRRHERVGA